jgi:hypothetical protein
MVCPRLAELLVSDKGKLHMGKLVIFLGAGASKTSGYPLGDDLRKDHLASAGGLRSQIADAFSAKKMNGQRRFEAIHRFNEWVKPVESSLQLFREGCFGTIDEFCKLIQRKKDSEVVNMKKVLRLALGLHNPEEAFTESDYYPFIQRLFADDLENLRDDIVVLSFNYDIYLEWLLRRACRTREKTLGQGQLADGLHSSLLGKVTSGFGGGESGQEAIRNGSDFCLLKLHGMIAWPNTSTTGVLAKTRDLGFDDVFEPRIRKRIDTLLSPLYVNSVPPIVFPWEIMDENGTFIEEDKFLLVDEPLGEGRHGDRTLKDPNLYSIFKETWIRARKEVKGASKISFVGLSFHEYLDHGFRFLFKDKNGTVELVVTDSENSNVSGQYFMQHDLAPTCPSARALGLLREHCKGLRCNPKAWVNSPGGGSTPPGDNSTSVKIRSDFADFIATEMGPTNQDAKSFSP